MKEVELAPLEVELAPWEEELAHEVLVVSLLHRQSDSNIVKRVMPTTTHTPAHQPETSPFGRFSSCSFMC